MSTTFLYNQSLGEYRIESYLGAGGMGEVWRASHAKIGRVAAVKVLTHATRSGGFVERFFNEARIQASLQHPNIATLYDFCEHDGQPCIIMEYVDGQTVAERVETCGPLRLSEALYVFEKVVEAIEYVHSHGVIHRDIKSNNIKVSSTGQVKLLDFGIAKGQTSPGLTAVGSVIGTLHYLAPEQVRGGVADYRGDIWSLGVLLYEMVTGRVPFDAETLGDLCDRIKAASYTPPAQLNSEVPREVSSIIARCLKRNPSERYQNAGELLRDVRQLASRPNPSEPAVVAPAGTGPSRLALAAGGGLVLVLLLVAGLVGVLMLATSEPAADVGGKTDTARHFVNNGSRPAQGDGEKRTIELQVVEGRADVYRNGERVGTTPFTLEARLGERVRLMLKRDGYKDEPIDFTVSEKKVYTFNMNR